MNLLMSINAPDPDSAAVIHSHIFHINFKDLLSGGCLNKIIHRKVSAAVPLLSFEGQNKNMDGIIAWLQSAGYCPAFTVAIAMLWGVFLHKCFSGGLERGWGGGFIPLTAQIPL